MEIKQGICVLKFDDEKLKEVLLPLYQAKKGIKIGFLDGSTNADTGKSIVEYAYYNEFGTEYIPARPFFRNAIKNNSDKWAAVLSKNLKDKILGYDPNGIIDNALNRLGVKAVADIQQSISRGSFAPLSLKTIRKKGTATPLIDSRDMFNAVNYEVVRVRDGFKST